MDTLLPLTQQSFPKMGLVRLDCIEMSWIDSILYFAGLSGEPLDILLNRTSSVTYASSYFKGKSDYVAEPIFEAGLESIWRRVLEDDISPYGGRLSEISELTMPFPYRLGTDLILHSLRSLLDSNGEKCTGQEYESDPKVL